MTSDGAVDGRNVWLGDGWYVWLGDFWMFGAATSTERHSIKRHTVQLNKTPCLSVNNGVFLYYMRGYRI